ncbi:MAG: ATP-binding protein [Ferruginibacter sp.]
MVKIGSLLFLICFCSAATAQFKVRFVLKEKTAIHHDSIYITGSFSNWDSTPDPRYLMKSQRMNEKFIVLNIKAGPVSYKFHRGNWFTVEKQYYGNEVHDRVVTINRDTTLTDSVVSWRDQVITDKWQALARQKSDTTRIEILAGIASNYAFYPQYYNVDSALSYANQALSLQQHVMASDEYESWTRNGHSYQLINLQEMIASLFHSLGNYPKSLELRLDNLNLADKEKNKFFMVQALRNITYDYGAMKDYQHVLHYAKLADSLTGTSVENGQVPKLEQWLVKYTIATAYYNLHLFDAALSYANKLEAIPESANYEDYLATKSLLLADIYEASGNKDSAFYFYRRTASISVAYTAGDILARARVGLARLFQKENRTDSALYYGLQAMAYIQNNQRSIQAWGENSNSLIAELSPLIAELYKANNQADSAYKYLHLSVAIKDSLYNSDKIKQFQTLTFNEAARRQQLEQQSREAKLKYETRVKIYSLITGMALIVILAFILFRNNKQKQKANILLLNQKREIETTLTELKTTQSQLIQSEKMASLGELTAGIAHEIQNPLNFVNNFSEVNKELLVEMKQEIDKGNTDEAKAIANDLIENEEKINHHGKRADAIVKGMLQHSRRSTGIKEPTDINALADEYFRLAYHGLRAKDKSFNATMKTEYDESIGNINIIPQDIGRVILNLITNAFYAASLAPKSGAGNTQHIREPAVWLSTKKVGDKVLISIKDNGPGIPQKVLDKIFQPFFTTKPTGQGTGLGLSLSYDIIKAHGGEIKVGTKDGEGAEFIIQLPVV